MKKDIQKVEQLVDLENVNQLGWLAFLHILAGNLDKANKLIHDSRLQLYTWRMRSEAEMAFVTGSWQEAIGKYDAIIKAFDLWSLDFFQKSWCHYRAAIAFYELGDFDNAILRVKESQGYTEPGGGLLLYLNRGAGHSFAYPLGFFLLGRIFEKRGDKQLAIQNYEKFVDLWKDADKDLPDLIDAKARLVRMKEEISQ